MKFDNIIGYFLECWWIFFTIATIFSIQQQFELDTPATILVVCLIGVMIHALFETFERKKT